MLRKITQDGSAVRARGADRYDIYLRRQAHFSFRPAVYQNVHVARGWTNDEQLEGSGWLSQVSKQMSCVASSLSTWHNESGDIVALYWVLLTLKLSPGPLRELCVDSLCSDKWAIAGYFKRRLALKTVIH